VRGLRGVRRFEYDSTYLMKIEEEDRPLVAFEYDRNSRLRELKLPDGRIYRFEYEFDRDNTKRVVRSIVTGPDNAVAKFEVAALNRGKR
jgi:hypothetical protein